MRPSRPAAQVHLPLTWTPRDISSILPALTHVTGKDPGAQRGAGTCKGHPVSQRESRATWLPGRALSDGPGPCGNNFKFLQTSEAPATHFPSLTGNGGSRPGGSQLSGSVQARAAARRVTLVFGGKDATRKRRCELSCLQEGQLPWCPGSSQNVSSCPCSTQPLHSLPPVPQPWHSPDRPSIPEMVLAFWRCLQWRPELAGDPRERPGRRGKGSSQACPWDLENSRTYTHASRNDDISGEEAGLQRAAPPFHGLVTPTMCLRCWGFSE